MRGKHGKKYRIEVRRYLGRKNHHRLNAEYEVIEVIQRVLRTEQIGNFSPLFCTYNKNERCQVFSDEGDLSDSFRRTKSYEDSLFIELGFCELPKDRIDPEVFEDVRAMARKAAKEDAWMTPCKDLQYVQMAFEEYEQRMQSDWTETDHWAHFYGQRLQKMLNDEMTRIDPEGEIISSDQEIEWHMELEDAFFSAWSAGHKLYDFWVTNLKTRVVKNPFAGCMNASAADATCWLCYRVLLRKEEVDRRICEQCNEEHPQMVAELVAPEVT